MLVKPPQRPQAPSQSQVVSVHKQMSTRRMSTSRGVSSRIPRGSQRRLTPTLEQLPIPNNPTLMCVSQTNHSVPKLMLNSSRVTMKSARYPSCVVEAIRVVLSLQVISKWVRFKSLVQRVQIHGVPQSSRTKDLNRTHLDITCRESTTLIASTTHEGYRADFIVTLDELSINFGTE